MVLHRGAGAYICGEETALLSSLEGERGQPRSKPPFPAVAGLYAAPTLVNNVETLAAVPFILEMGAEAYAALGTERSKGTRVFSLSGNVRRPGNYELPLTSTLRDLIEGQGGGAPEGRTIKAIIPGGSSTPILLPDQLDTGIDYESIAAAGSMAGSGAIVVIDDRTCMVQLALRVAEFYKHESCGKCTPCREGTRWGVDIIRRIEMGEAAQGDLDLLLNVCDRILGKCLCPLGDAMAMPVASYVDAVPRGVPAAYRRGRLSLRGSESDRFALPRGRGGAGMSTFHDAFLDARRRIESASDPEEVVPVLLRLAEAADEDRPRAGSLRTTTTPARTSDV